MHAYQLIKKRKNFIKKKNVDITDRTLLYITGHTL